MKFTLSWLKDYLKTETSVEAIVANLNKIGLEVEEVVDNSQILKDFNCVKIEECINHPDSDHLHVCSVRYSNNEEPITVVCGAPNARTGLKTVLAPVGSNLPNGINIKKTKIRGIESNGMLCSMKELGIGEEYDGIIELDEDTKIGENVADIFNLNDQLFDISITPNRGDALSVYGIARDLSVVGIGELKELETIESERSFDSEKHLLVEDKNCHYYSFRQIKNIKNCESPNWLKNKLSSIGINPKNAIVDITNYTMFTFGQPLHGYDLDKIKGDIYVRSASGKETFVDLFEKEYNLNGGETIICDAEKILCLGGIVGGFNSGTELDTKNVLLEAANFDPINTAKNLGIDSDSKYRFERGIDSEMTYFVINFATKLILEICGGEVSNLVEFFDGDYKKSKTRNLELDLEKIYALTGLEIEESEILRILTKLGYEIIERNDKVLNLLIPSWKNNIIVYQDIIDDFVRIYGYDRLNNNDFTDSKYYEKDGNNFVKCLKNKLYQVRKKLAENKMTELLTYAFINKEDCSFFAKTNDNLEVINPIISELSYMRQSLIPNILNIVKKNNDRGFENLSLFEIGRIFNSNKPTDENSIVAGVRYGKNKEKDIYENVRDFDIFDVKKDIFDILSIFGINGAKMSITKDIPNYYHPNRSGAIVMGKTILGYFGELHPSINKHFDLKNRINIFEFFVDNLPKKSILDNRNVSGFKVNNLQPVERDFAFILDKNIEIGVLIKDVQNTNKELIKDIKLFDIYYDEKIQDKKSIAFKVILQPIEKTLAKEDIDAISKIIIETVETKYKAELRDK